MRAIYAVVLLALLLALSGAGVVQVAGDIGPGQNGSSGSIPAFTHIAGDIGPGQN